MEVRKMVYPAKVRSTSKELTEDGTVANLVKKDLGVIGEAVWLQPRESDVQIREEHLSRCLVRWFGKVLDLLLGLTLMEKLGTNLWFLQKRGEGGLWGSFAFI